MISMPVEYSVQTVHLSCAEINTIFRQTETSLHLTHVTLEYHRVCPKWFPSLWYVQRKLCTYHASRLILSPNGPKQASISPTSHKSSIGCAQNDCHAHGTFGATVHLYYDDVNTNSKWTETSSTRPTSCRSTTQCRPKWFLSQWYVWRKPCTYLALRLILSPNRLNRASTWPTSSRGTIRCAQSDFIAFGTFGANRAHILPQD
jgi:hypothetical protein